MPLVYPPLVYLLARMLWIGFRGGEGLRPSLPVRWLGLAAVVLIAFRMTINIADSGVIDVGYAGTIGADRITHGEPLYGEGEFPDDNRFGDTYGPANYYAYVPFELALPVERRVGRAAPPRTPPRSPSTWRRSLGLFVCGDCACAAGAPAASLGILLAFAWVAYPYTAFALQSNSNDSLVAALLVWSLALFARPLARGALLAAGGDGQVRAAGAGAALRGRRARPARRATREAPQAGAALRPVAHVRARRSSSSRRCCSPIRRSIRASATFFDRTVVSQLDRTSPFSIWGQVDGIQWLQTAVLAATARARRRARLRPAPPRRSPRSRRSSAAVLIALQLSVDHWFYLYIPWFFGALMIALLCLPASERVSGAG